MKFGEDNIIKSHLDTRKKILLKYGKMQWSIRACVNMYGVLRTVMNQHLHMTQIKIHLTYIDHSCKKSVNSKKHYQYEVLTHIKQKKLIFFQCRLFYK